MSTKVLIDAAINIPYGSFYLQGLFEIYRPNQIKFVRKPFLQLNTSGWNMRFIIKNGQNELKVFIHTNDSYKIDLQHYEWCDIYGHVNANFAHYPKDCYPKLIALVPSFGIRNFTLFQTCTFATINFVKAFKEIKNRSSWNKYLNKQESLSIKNFKKFFSSYYKNYFNRLPLSVYYSSKEINSNYIFFLSTLWYSNEINNNDEGVNRRRANFVEVCKELHSCNFEGGLVGDDSSSSQLFLDSITTMRVPLNKWIEKTKQSTFVFNTPAFWDCHGWKLGEYLAMGKAIITTPLSNDLPAPLVHGFHVHVIKDGSKESIKEAILLLLQNPEYRFFLEKNAREYWDKYGTPGKSLMLLGIHRNDRELK